MDTKSRDEDARRASEEPSAEPVGLSATAVEARPISRPRTSIPPQHQEAVELTLSARRHLREGRREDARSLYLQAAKLERQVLGSVESQPERSLIAESGARAALQGGDFELARALARKGLEGRPPEHLHWPLLRAFLQADLLKLLERFDRHLRVEWDEIDEEGSRALVVLVGTRRISFDIDPAAVSVESEPTARELTFVIPESPLDGPARSFIDESVMDWLRPRRSAQPVWERGIAEFFLLEPSPA